MPEKIYIAIDLKSFYASVECVDRGLDPLTTNLVVADASRTEKTICLAVSPSLKAYGIGGRARLFEVVQRVREVNYDRKRKANWRFSGKSFNDTELKAHPDWELDYIAAPPRMAHYMEVSSQVYQTYLKYIAPEDIHVYSIDEVFMDVTAYLKSYKMTAHELAMKMIRDVLKQTGITATAGIGTNMYLCKVAMDIVAKHIPADKDGVRIGELDEMSYRQQLWNHRPLTSYGQDSTDVLAERGTVLSAFRRECGTADRPCVGMGTVYDGLSESLQARKQLLQQRTSASVCLRRKESPRRSAGNGRCCRSGSRCKETRDRPAGADRGLRHREPDEPCHPSEIQRPRHYGLLWPSGAKACPWHGQPWPSDIFIVYHHEGRGRTL